MQKQCSNQCRLKRRCTCTGLISYLLKKLRFTAPPIDINEHDYKFRAAHNQYTITAD